MPKRGDSSRSLSSLFDERPLSESEIAQGMHLCFRNAEELIEDAELLRSKNRNARAFSLAVLALEELGKIPMLGETLSYGKADDAKWKKFWKEFRRHHAKQEVIGGYGKVILSSMGKRFKLKTEIDGIFETLADPLKQLGFYVTFFHDSFSLPYGFFRGNPTWVNFAIEAARERIEMFRPLHSTLARSKRFIRRGITFFRDLSHAVQQAGAATPEEFQAVIRAHLESKYRRERGADGDRKTPAD